MLGKYVIVLGSKGHCQLEEERIIYEDVEVEGDDYLECIEDDVEELDSDFERDLGIVSGCDGDYLEHERENIVKEETSSQQRNLLLPTIMEANGNANSLRYAYTT